MGTLHAVLQRFAERYRQKRHLHLLTRDWRPRIGVVVRDGSDRACLVVAADGVALSPWREGESCELTLSGTERDLLLYFGGDALAHVYARDAVAVAGTVRDRLKLEALVRLAAVSDAGA